MRTSPVNGVEAAVTYCCEALELRRYEVPEGRVASMTELFDQENTAVRGYGKPGAGGQYFIGWMENVALFRDLDRPNVHIWMRGFGTIDEAQVNGFYYRSLWARHTDILARAAITPGDAYMVEPAPYMSGFLLGTRGASPISGENAGLLVATVYTVPLNMAGNFQSFFHYSIVPRVYEAGGRPLASFATSSRVSNSRGFRSVFKPKLIEGDQNFIWFARFADTAAYARFQTKLARDQEWKDKVDPVLKNLTKGPPEVWRLVPVWQWRPMF